MEQNTGYGSRVTVTGGAESLVGGAVLKIGADKKTDLQFHIHTTKVYYVLSGKLRISVMKDGALRSVEASEGGAFAVNRGLVYQLSGIEDTVVVEFTSRPENYLVEDGKMMEDVTVIAKGTVLAEVKDGEFATMSGEDEQKEAAVAAKTSLSKAVSKRAASRKKKPTKKRTTKKTTKKTSRSKK